MKRLEETVKKLLKENKDKPSPLQEIYEMSKKRSQIFENKSITKESILEKYKKLF